jgi:hypothetical protein
MVNFLQHIIADLDVLPQYTVGYLQDKYWDSSLSSEKWLSLSAQFPTSFLFSLKWKSHYTSFFTCVSPLGFSSERLLFTKNNSWPSFLCAKTKYHSLPFSTSVPLYLKNLGWWSGLSDKSACLARAKLWSQAPVLKKQNKTNKQKNTYHQNYWVCSSLQCTADD